MKDLAIKTILAPVDFSAPSEGEAAGAAQIAKRLGARLILAHVIPAFDHIHSPNAAVATAYSHPFDADTRRDLETALEEMAEGLRTNAAVEIRISSGDPATEIEKLAADEHADLIVLPTRGSGRFRRVLLGSVTRKVLHDVETPVLTGVHREHSDPTTPTFRRIGVLVDLQAGSEEIVRWAYAFAVSFRAELSLLHILPGLATLGADHYVGEDALPATTERARVRAAELLARVGIEAPITVQAGEIEQALPEAVERAEVDLVITGRQRPNIRVGLAGVRSDLYQTILHTPVPILSLPETPEPKEEPAATQPRETIPPELGPQVRHDHRESESEHVLWLADARQWRAGHRRVLATLADVQAAVLEQDAALDAHVAQIHRHEMLRLRHELEAAAPERADELAASHRTLEREHAQAREAHRRLSEHHRNVRRLVEDLTEETRKAM